MDPFGDGVDSAVWVRAWPLKHAAKSRPFARGRTARRAASSAVPTVDLISCDRLAKLTRSNGESGVKLRPTVDTQWFDKFE